MHHTPITILVTGGAGQLGTCVRNASAVSHNNYIFADVDELDVTSASAIESYMQQCKPHVVLNCAAYTAVEAAEDAPEEAFMLNTQAPALLAAACRRHDARLVHISTDYVYGGGDVNTPIAEDTPPAPVGIYGSSKWLGEQAVIQSGCKYTIVRTAWLYSRFGRNFALTMLRLFGEKESVSVVADQTGTPTYAPDLAGALVKIIDSGEASAVSGIYNYTNLGTASWYDFAQALADISGAKCRVIPCATSDYKSKARRPAFSVLDKKKIIAEFGIEIPYWRHSAERLIREIGMMPDNEL